MTTTTTPRPARLSGEPPYVVTSPAPSREWEEVIASAPLALPTQTPAWLRCVCTVGGWQDASRLYQTSDGRRLVLPMVRRSWLGGLVSIAASLPTGWGPGGLVGEGGIVRPEDVRMVFSDLTRHQPLQVSLRPDPVTTQVWEEAAPPRVSRQLRLAQVLFLDGGFDQVWRKRFRSDARNRVRRAQRSGVVVECDDTGRLVPVFEHLYARSIERWARHDGVPLALARWRAARREPPEKLRAVAATLGSRMRIYIAYVEGRPAAGAVVVFGTGTAMYWRSAIDEELAGKSYANYLLQRTAIEDAAAAGCHVYQMGDSAPGSTLALFKSRFGAVDQPYASYRVERLPVGAVAGVLRRATADALRRLRGRR